MAASPSPPPPAPPLPLPSIKPPPSPPLFCLPPRPSPPRSPPLLSSLPSPSWLRPFGRGLAHASLVAALGLTVTLNGVGEANARPQGVNRPELLPEYFTPVIDVAGFLSEGQEGRISKELMDLEEETGFKLRLLAQNYPNTPGLAVRDYWKVDDNTIVFVADPSLGGNILNFNVGAAVDLNVPRSFWSRLSGKYGNIFYWQEKGEDASIEAAVSAISACLREPPGPRACSNID